MLAADRSIGHVAGTHTAQEAAAAPMLTLGSELARRPLTQPPRATVVPRMLQIMSISLATERVLETVTVA